MFHRRSVGLALVLLAFLAPVRAQRAPADVERRIDELVAKMTLEEKLGQLQMLDGHAEGGYRPEHVGLVREGRLGSTLNVRGAKRVNELQRVAVEQSRLKIPLVFAFDVIHGYRTIFPVPLGETASWDPAAVERGAAVAAAEASSAGVNWTFAPMVDIARDARWGRIVEGAGEDPYLGSVMAHARVRGFQGEDYSAPDRVVACAKHWVAYGAAEGGRDYNTTDVTERALREIYFPPFKAAVDAGVGTFMSAFNDVDGVPASANPFTLTDVLRGEWKWDGVVVSDYESVRELMNHGIAATEADAARLALSAGVDIEMVSRLYNAHGVELVRSGALSTATVDEAVRRVLRLKFRLGLFENPYVDESLEAKTIMRPDFVASAREVAARSLVLLENKNGVLPLAKTTRSIAVIGPLADSKVDMIGSWSGDGKAEDAVTILEGIRAKVGASAKITYVKGCEVESDDTSGFDEAARAARDADVAILVVGESAAMSGEASSRSKIDLPGRQLDLVKAIHATGKPVVVVLANGRPLAIPWIAENVPAVLESWFLGSQAGHAVADALFGDVNPGGKLPVTFPRSVGQVPIYYAHKSTGRPPTDQKYTSKYLDVPVTPLYPFGYGLSYTRFELSDLKLSATRVRAGDEVRVSVELKNAGSRAGDEVVQLYVRDMAGSVTRPVKQLRGFERIALAPGATKRVEFTLGRKDLELLGRDLKPILEPGAFTVTVGTDSASGLTATFEVVE
jgi:beta-glucosidase